jgi:hypothetical protein
MSDSEILEVQIDTNGTIYKIEELWLQIMESKLLLSIF